MFYAMHALAATLPLSIAASSLIFFPLASIYLGAARWTFRIYPPSWSLIEKAFLLFWGISLFSALCGVSPRDSVRAVSKDLYFLVFFLGASLVRTDEARWRVLWTFMGFSALSGFLGVLQYAVGIQQPDSHDLTFKYLPAVLTNWPPVVLDYLSTLGGRAAGTRSHPLTYAEGLLFGLATVLAAWSIFPSRRKHLLLAGLLMMAGIVFSQSRGPWLVAGLLMGAALAVEKSMRRRWKALIVLAPLAVLMLTPVLRDRLFSIGDMKHRSNAERLRMWKAGVELWKDNVLLGVGPGNVKRAISPYQQPEDKREGPYGHLHNSFVHVLAERGLLGLLSFLGLMGLLVYGSWRRWKQDDPSTSALGLLGLLSCGAFLTAGLTERVYGDTEIMMIFYFVLGLCGPAPGRA